MKILGNTVFWFESTTLSSDFFFFKWKFVIIHFWNFGSNFVPNYWPLTKEWRRKIVKYHSHIVLLPFLFFLYFCTQVIKTRHSYIVQPLIFCEFSQLVGKDCGFHWHFLPVRTPTPLGSLLMYLNFKNMWVRDIRPKCNYAQFEILLFMIHILI